VRDQQNISPVTTAQRTNKKLRKANGRPQKQNPNKKLQKPDAKQKNKPHELSTNFPLPRSNKKL
jgi:hypothetical protein